MLSLHAGGVGLQDGAEILDFSTPGTGRFVAPSAFCKDLCCA
jgi:hypothetical protein